MHGKFIQHNQYQSFIKKKAFDLVDLISDIYNIDFVYITCRYICLRFVLYRQCRSMTCHVSSKAFSQFGRTNLFPFKRSHDMHQNIFHRRYNQLRACLDTVLETLHRLHHLQFLTPLTPKTITKLVDIRIYNIIFWIDKKQK